MDDLISRAAALEVLEAVKNLTVSQDGKVLCGKLYSQIKDLHAVDAVPVVRCKNCKYFEAKDIWENYYADSIKVPILVASDVPTCHRWGDECRTSQDGFCFLGERRDDDGKDA